MRIRLGETGCQGGYEVSHGFTISIPKPLKSRTFLVATVRPCVCAVPAINRSIRFRCTPGAKCFRSKIVRTTLRSHDQGKGRDPYSPRGNAPSSQRVVPDVGLGAQAAIRIRVHGSPRLKAIGLFAETRNRLREDPGDPLSSQTRRLCPEEIRSYGAAFVLFNILEGNLTMGHSATLRDFKIGPSGHILH